MRQGGDNEDGRQRFTAEVYVVEKSKGANTFNL